jgi:hypothetical protein
MQVLVTGNGTAGSWKVRGEQLGKAIGATVKPHATDDDIRQADTVIVVKRLSFELANKIRAHGKRLVWDCVDPWPQPSGNLWQREECRRWLRHELAKLSPDAVVYATESMREDADDPRPSLVLPHHARPGIERNPIRQAVKVVGYEGRDIYLSHWHSTLKRECRMRGWEFVTNPQKLADLDIVVALRGGEWDGYACRHWKSYVKLANAQASGTPFIGGQESGYLETQTGGEYWAGSPRMLAVAFDWLVSKEARDGAAERLLRADVSLPTIASRYGEWISSLGT